MSARKKDQNQLDTSDWAFISALMSGDKERYRSILEARRQGGWMAPEDIAEWTRQLERVGIDVKRQETRDRLIKAARESGDWEGIDEILSLYEDFRRELSGHVQKSDRARREEALRQREESKREQAEAEKQQARAEREKAERQIDKIYSNNDKAQGISRLTIPMLADELGYKDADGLRYHIKYLHNQGKIENDKYLEPWEADIIRRHVRQNGRGERRAKSE